MELRYYWRVLQSGWWIIVLATLAALTVALAFIYVTPSTFRSTARFVAKPNVTAIGAGNLVESLNTLDKRSIAVTYSEILMSQHIAAETAQGLKMDALTLAQYPRVATVLPESNILELSVTGTDPEMTTRLANGIGQGAIEYIKTLYQVYVIDFLDPAAVPTIPISPQPLRDISLAVVLGLVIGIGVAIVREQIRTPFESLRRRQMFDTLSSAYSRRYLERRLREEMALQHGGVFSFSLMRLDGLDGLSETLPQPVLSQLLHHITRTLQTELRGRDSVARWDEITFAVLLPATPCDAALRTIQRVQRVLTTPIPLVGSVHDTVLLDPHAVVAISEGNDSANYLMDRAVESLANLKDEQVVPVVM